MKNNTNTWYYIIIKYWLLSEVMNNLGCRWIIYISIGACFFYLSSPPSPLSYPLSMTPPHPNLLYQNYPFPSFSYPLSSHHPPFTSSSSSVSSSLSFPSSLSSFQFSIITLLFSLSAPHIIPPSLSFSSSASYPAIHPCSILQLCLKFWTHIRKRI